MYGGGFDIEQRFIDPTVLYPSTWDDTALQQEVFGPVLPVLPYSDLGEVIDVIKRKPKSLAAYTFSKDQSVIDRFLGSVSFGGGCVNRTNLHRWVDALPLGGAGNSGMGKHDGKAGIDALSNAKAMLIGDPDVFPPYTGKDMGPVLKLFE